MPKTIDTIKEREIPIKKVIAGTLVSVGLLLTGITGEYYFDADIDLYVGKEKKEQKVTGKEYDDLLKQYRIISDDFANNPIKFWQVNSQQDKDLMFAVITEEAQKCEETKKIKQGSFSELQDILKKGC